MANTTSQSVGDIMQDAKLEVWKRLVMLAGVLVYIAGVVYAEVHGWTLLSNGVSPDMQIWAGLGMVALGITALALPLALHAWTFDATHRMAAIAFYVVDIALLGLNSFVDFSVNEGQVLAGWAQMYFQYILPATPVIAAVGWGLLFLLDPAQKMLQIQQELKAAMQASLAQQIVEAAKSSAVAAEVNEAARKAVSKVSKDLFGVALKEGDEESPFQVFTKKQSKKGKEELQGVRDEVQNFGEPESEKRA